VLEATRHSKKLKRGSLAGNQFNIRVRDWTGDKAVLEQQLQTIKTQGVPDYFIDSSRVSAVKKLCELSNINTSPTSAWFQVLLATLLLRIWLNIKDQQFEQLAKGLCAFGVDQDRRALRSHIQELQWQFIDNKTLELSFTLNPGCYATALLREIVKVA
jgi:tRNA(Glu) U13 pseudouridine synthase TruD